VDRSHSQVTLALLASLITACADNGEPTGEGGSTMGGSGSDANGDSSAPAFDGGDEDEDAGSKEDGGSKQDGGGEDDGGLASCADSVRNNDETDVDCGGACGGCELTERCEVASDCLSGYCGLKSCRAAGFYAFDDGYAPGIGYSPYQGSVGAAVVDNAEHYVGTASLRIDVPASDYIGGSLQAPAADLKDYDALVFWAKASAAKTLDVVGFGADGAGDTLRVQRRALALTTTWTRFIVPIPDPSMMTATVDHFAFAEGSDEGVYSVWFDEVRFARLGDVLGTPQAELLGGPATVAPNADFTVSAPVVRYTVEGAEIAVEAGTGHFEFDSSDDAVATIDAKGKGKAVAEGEATITASLRGVKVSGSRVITVKAVPTAPSTAAPTPPTRQANDVRSLFSGAYANVAVGTFRTDWSQPNTVAVEDTTAGGDAVKRYTNLGYVGITFESPTVNASALDTVHLDVWTPGATVLKVKLVDFGANGVYDGGDDSNHELTLNSSSTPTPLTTGAWVSFDLPLASFSNLAARAHLAQVVLSAETAPATVYIDNFYLYKKAP